VVVDLRDVAVVPLLAAVPSAALAAMLNGSLVSLCTVPALSTGQKLTQDEIQVCVDYAPCMYIKPNLHALVSELCGCRPVAVYLGDVAVVPSVALAVVIGLWWLI
jgi:hypothetical protein